MPQIYVEGNKEHWQTVAGMPVHAFARELINIFTREFFDVHETAMSVKQVSGGLRYVQLWTKALQDQKVRVYHLEYEIKGEPLLRMKCYNVEYTTCTESNDEIVSITKRELADLQAQACLNRSAVHYDQNSDPRKKVRYE